MQAYDEFSEYSSKVNVSYSAQTKEPINGSPLTPVLDPCRQLTDMEITERPINLSEVNLPV